MVLLIIKHPNMVFPLQLLVLLLAFISHEPEAIAQSPFHTQVAPITKHTDAATPLYSIRTKIAVWFYTDVFRNFLIDIDAPFTWHNCTVDWDTWIYEGSKCLGCTQPVPCEEYICTDVRTSYSYKSPSCLPVTNTSTLPGFPGCTCPVNVVNPVGRTSCGQALLNYDTFTFATTDGKSRFQNYYITYRNAACAPSSMFDSFPKYVTGVMAFSTSPYAFPASLIQPLSKTFALCLPSSVSSLGVMFFGSGPYYLPPNSDIDLTSLLSYTPLLNHTDSLGYFIGVKSITVKGRSINVSKSTTKLSTIDSYTILRADIYKQVVRMFTNATVGILRARPVAPFGFCLKYQIRHSLASLKIPDIVFTLQGGKKWRIPSTNSMQQVKKNVACLAFVNGGATTEHGIVIGAFQMEDNFLLFDIDNSSFGFSSSLLSKKTSCSHFNFTRHI